MAVNANAWKRFPVADREQTFNADQAIVRIADWAKGSVDKFSSAFLWRNPQGPPNNKNSYRLPVGDIIDGRLTLVPHAIFAAAAILSGAHGGLVGVVSDEEKKQIKGVVTDIYAMLQQSYGDPRMKPPWLRGGNKEEEVTASVPPLTASVNSSGWGSMPLADEGTSWSGDSARKALWDWADGDFRQYRKGFLWWDRSAPDQKNSYKLPIATVVDGELRIVPRAVTAVAQVLGGARGGVDIPDGDMDAVEAVVKRIQKRFSDDPDGAEGDTDADEAVAAAAAPVRPPRNWFQNPNLNGPTPLVVTADGQVYGHLAAWGTCHTGKNRCVTAPRTASGYKYFLNGSVLTADGSTVKVGKITLGTGHADLRMGWIPAADHYDNTGSAVAVVASGEDRFGIWVAGALTPDTTEERAAELRRSPLSGDWRPIGGSLELIAALAVNAPGFPIVSLTASGEPEAVLAAGVILEDGTIQGLVPEGELSEADKNLLERVEKLQRQAVALNRNRLARRLNNLVSGGFHGMQ
jgi:hypothetical protein